MGYTLEQFASQCHDLLKAEPGPAGREKVRQLLQKVLVDEDFVRAHLGSDNTTAKQIIYQDAELDFCILAHVHLDSSESKPHDHGPTWAIYGQAKGVTQMSAWRLLAKPADGKPGMVELDRKYDLEPGQAALYNEGDLHSPKRVDETRLIRITGLDVDKIKRDSYRVAETVA